MPMPISSNAPATSSHAAPMNSLRPFPASPRPGSSAESPAVPAGPRAVSISRGADRASIANGSGAALVLGLAGYVVALPLAAATACAAAFLV